MIRINHNKNTTGFRKRFTESDNITYDNQPAYTCQSKNNTVSKKATKKSWKHMPVVSEREQSEMVRKSNQKVKIFGS